MSMMPIPCLPPRMFRVRMISDTFIFLPLTDTGTPFSKLMVTYSGFAGAFSGVTPSTRSLL